MAEDLFCAVCGTRTVNGVCPKCNPDMAQGGYGNADYDRYRKIFVDSNEQFVGALGNNYLQNFLTSGSVGNGYAAISNKRVYFNGTTFTKNEKNRFVKQNESKIVDLKDVTGTGLVAFNNIGAIFGGVISFVMAAVMLISGIAMNPRSGGGILSLLGGVVFLFLGIFCIVMYNVRKTTLLKIDFAGGCIAFDIKLYNRAEVDTFQRNIRIAKDNALKEEENRSANAIRSAMSAMPQQSAPAASSADELMKYASMLEKGLITQEEFNAAKARLL
ncbi:MAG: SHOCT domain-containing protein [Ruminiclostridium sp.]|nr:SHOCT domain-containing protein [Ruminiclostridium sp.]